MSKGISVGWCLTISEALGGASFANGAIIGVYSEQSEQVVVLFNHFGDHVDSSKGFISKESKEDTIKYIYNKSHKIGKEMGMIDFKYKDGLHIYVVTPWKNNDATTTNFDYSGIDEISMDYVSKEYYHTHLSDNGPSYTDYNNFTIGHAPKATASYVISNSNVWSVNRYNGYLAPRQIAFFNAFNPYGRIISDVNSFIHK